MGPLYDRTSGDLIKDTSEGRSWRAGVVEHLNLVGIPPRSKSVLGNERIAERWNLYGVKKKNRPNMPTSK
jgi:hypothetical protein